MRLLVIQNPRSGRANAGFEEFVRFLNRLEADVEIRELKNGQPIADILKDASMFDRVVISGGDGTIGNAAYALRNTNIPIAIFPSGTGNLLASNLGISGKPEEVARLAVLGKTVDIDIAELELRKLAHPSEEPHKVGFVLNAGAGIDSYIVARAKELKSRLKNFSYLVAALQSFRHPAYEFTIEIDGVTLKEKAMGVLILNFGKLQFDVPIVKDSDPNDGQLEVIIIKPGRNLPAKTLQNLIAKKGLTDPELQEYIVVRFGNRIRISSEPPLIIQYDGELTQHTTPFEAKVLPRAARFVVPNKEF